MDCSFCGKTIPIGTGIMYVKKDGKIFYFCTSKCEKNQIKLKRVPRHTTWTKAYAKKKVLEKRGTKGKAPAKAVVKEAKK